jgi:DNA-directed RNA polymerase beta subunit
MNAGLIASLVVHARVNTQGFLETPFYNISEISREEGIIHLSAGEDEYHRIATRNFGFGSKNSESIGNSNLLSTRISSYYLGTNTSSMYLSFTILLCWGFPYSFS